MMTTDSRLAPPAELAEYLGTSTQQLARMRVNGTGPRYIRAGRSVRYRWSDVQAWLDENTRERTSGEGD